MNNTYTKLTERQLQGNLDGVLDRATAGESGYPSRLCGFYLWGGGGAVWD